MFNKNGGFMNIFKKKKEVYENAWDKYYDKDKRNISIPNISIYDYFERTTINHEYDPAINYFGEKTSYIELISKIDLCAKALASIGIRENDVVTICLPNVPEAIISFYAVNKIGAIASMLHPLSSEEEIKDSLIKTKSVCLFLHNASYEKVENIIDSTKVYKTILISPRDSMPSLLGLGYLLTKDLKVKIPKNTEKFMYWYNFLEKVIYTIKMFLKEEKKKMMQLYFIVEVQQVRQKI